MVDHTPEKLAISVVIPCFNDAPFLQCVLTALATQTYPPAEIVVVDNNSTDDSAAVARGFPNVVVVAEPRQGIMQAATTGYDYASGDLIARVDADSILPTDYLEKLSQTWETIRVQQRYLPKKVVATTGSATFAGSTGVLGRAYLPAYYATTRTALGHYPLFGTNCSLLTSWWWEVRDGFDRDAAEVHDDLHLSFMVRSDETVWYEPHLSVGMDGRALKGVRQLTRRFYRGMCTMVINFRSDPPPCRLARRGLLAIGPRLGRGQK